LWSYDVNEHNNHEGVHDADKCFTHTLVRCLMYSLARMRRLGP
jgi:hypothetical protein